MAMFTLHAFASSYRQPWTNTVSPTPFLPNLRGAVESQRKRNNLPTSGILIGLLHHFATIQFAFHFCITAQTAGSTKTLRAILLYAHLASYKIRSPKILIFTTTTTNHSPIHTRYIAICFSLAYRVAALWTFLFKLHLIFIVLTLERTKCAWI